MAIVVRKSKSVAKADDALAKYAERLGADPAEGLEDALRESGDPGTGLRTAVSLWRARQAATDAALKRERKAAAKVASEASATARAAKRGKSDRRIWREADRLRAEGKAPHSIASLVANKLGIGVRYVRKALQKKRN